MTRLHLFKGNATPLLAITILSALLSSVASAQINLIIDITDPNAVVFTPTLEPSMNNCIADSFNDGITMIGLLPGNTMDLNYELMPSEGFLDTLSFNPGELNSLFSNIYAGGWTHEDLSIFQWDNVVIGSGTFTMYFNGTQPALIGGITTGALSSFPIAPAGSTGALITGTPDAPCQIGHWEVVPEPSSALLAAFGMLAGLLGRRKRR